MLRVRSIALALALSAGPATTAATAAPARVQAVATTHATNDAKGVVQRLAGNRIRLRALDGTDRWITLALRVAIRVNDLPAVRSEIRPGYVAQITLGKNGRATRILAYGTVPLRIDQGTVEAATSTTVALRNLKVGVFTLAIAPTTSVTSADGTAGTLEQVLPGARIAVEHRGREAALRIRILAPAPVAPSVFVVDRGRVTAVGADSVTLRRGTDGAFVTLLVDRSTQFVGGPREALVVGTRISVRHAPDGPALVVTLLQAP